jgi:hypothetical protein
MVKATAVTGLLAGHELSMKAQVAAFIESCGLLLEEHRNFGQETGRKRATAAFAMGAGLVNLESFQTAIVLRCEHPLLHKALSFQRVNQRPAIPLSQHPSEHPLFLNLLSQDLAKELRQ